jgi:hypothetical protein
MLSLTHTHLQVNSTVLADMPQQKVARLIRQCQGDLVLHVCSRTDLPCVVAKSLCPYLHVANSFSCNTEPRPSPALVVHLMRLLCSVHCTPSTHHPRRGASSARRSPLLRRAASPDARRASPDIKRAPSSKWGWLPKFLRPVRSPHSSLHRNTPEPAPAPGAAALSRSESVERRKMTSAPPSRLSSTRRSSKQTFREVRVLSSHSVHVCILYGCLCMCVCLCVLNSGTFEHSCALSSPEVSGSFLNISLTAQDGGPLDTRSPPSPVFDSRRSSRNGTPDSRTGSPFTPSVFERTRSHLTFPPVSLDLPRSDSASCQVSPTTARRSALGSTPPQTPLPGEPRLREGLSPLRDTPSRASGHGALASPLAGPMTSSPMRLVSDADIARLEAAMSIADNILTRSVSSTSAPSAPSRSPLPLSLSSHTPRSPPPSPYTPTTARSRVQAVMAASAELRGSLEDLTGELADAPESML